MTPVLNGLQRFPTEGISGGNEPEASPKKRTPQLPNKDADVGNVAKAVALKWAQNPQITLVWLTVAQFAAEVAAYVSTAGTASTVVSVRPSQAQQLRQLDKTISKGMSSLKIDIQHQFGKALAFAEYRRYGLEKERRRYELPLDRNQRLAALRLTLAAVQADGTGSGRYDAAFWTTLLADYEQAIRDARQTDSSIAGLAAAKKVQKKNILKAMRALQKVLQGNYPDTYKAVFREWGWQKEDY